MGKQRKNSFTMILHSFWDLRWKLNMANNSIEINLTVFLRENKSLLNTKKVKESMKWLFTFEIYFRIKYFGVRKLARVPE